MYNPFFKRIVDLLLSLTVVCILSPVFAIVSLLVYLNMGRPVLYTQERTGKTKKKFTIYKFRTMRLDLGRESDQDRLTPLGVILRRWSLNELPQLFNVIKGDMSLVGPRPLLPEYDVHYSHEQNRRFLVKPGITGLAQTSGRNNLQWDEKFSLDVAYVENLSAWNDFKILIRTMFVVLGAKGFQESGEEKKFSDL